MSSNFFFMLYTGIVADQNDHFNDVFIRKNLPYGYKVVTTFANLQQTPFCLEKSSVRKGIFTDLAAFFGHCGPRARHIYPSLVLVKPRITRPCLTERLLMGRKELNQTNKMPEYRSHMFVSLH